jgi:hypothetical protein
VSKELPAVVFLRGCPRSGTTLLANLLNENEGVGILAEQPLGDVAQRLLPVFWYEEAIEREHETLQRRAAQRSSAPTYEPLDSLQRMRELHPYPTRRRLAHILRAIVEASLNKDGLRVIGSKTPGHWSAAELQLVRSCFERVLDVFMVRNPLDTLNSMINRRNKARVGLDASWPDKPIGEAIARYQEATCLLFSCVRRFPDDTFVVGYEELHAAPRRVLAALGEFLGTEVSDRTGLIGAPHEVCNVLTAAEEAEARRAFGTAIASWKSKRITGPAIALGGTLDDCLRVVQPGVTYRCDAPAGDRGLLGSGWSGAQASGIESDAPEADLFFAVPREARYRLVMEAIAEGARWNGSKALVMDFCGARSRSVLRIGRRNRIASAPLALLPERAHRATLEMEDLRLRLRSIRFEML